MNANETLISHFYKSFQNKDYHAMQSCYADEAEFNDEVFVNLNASEVKAMWEMLIKNGKDLHVEVTNIAANDKNGTADWVADYTFSRSGNKVTNRIKAEFTFKNGKIVKHRDHFHFYTWARQALGTAGLLLGWTPFMKNKIRTTALRNLDAFMGNK